MFYVSKRGVLHDIKRCDLKEADIDTVNGVLYESVSDAISGKKGIKVVHSCVDFDDIDEHYGWILKHDIVYKNVKEDMCLETLNKIERSEHCSEWIESRMYKRLIEYASLFEDERHEKVMKAKDKENIIAEIKRLLPDTCEYSYSDAFDALIIKYGLEKWMIYVDIDSYCVLKDTYEMKLYHYNQVKMKKGGDYHLQFSRRDKIENVCNYIVKHQHSFNKRVTFGSISYKCPKYNNYKGAV